MFILKNPITNQSAVVDSLSRQATVEEIRLFAYARFSFDAANHCLRLFCRGKELVDGCTLFEYGIKDGDVIAVTIRTVADLDPLQQGKFGSIGELAEEDSVELNTSYYHKVGDRVDVQCLENGAWYEAIVSKITVNCANENRDPNINLDQALQDNLLYHCTYESYGKSTDIVCLSRLVPRAHRSISFDVIEPSSSFLLVNYNVEAPGRLGEWYCARFVDKIENRREKVLICDLILRDGKILASRKITKIDEIYLFEGHQLLSERPLNCENSKLRTTLQCSYCYDEKKVCNYCRCVKCKSGHDDDKILLCEECDEAYHIFCLDPPLLTVPEDDFYCPDCRIDHSKVVKAGEKVKLSKRQLNMPSIKGTCKRKWDSGQACKGLTKRCTKVGADFFGPIPGVEVGTTWQFQMQLAEAGIHRMVVAGIHGSKMGAFSIVASGGYEDDTDAGDEIYYTGSGGRDLSGNKRTAGQSKDQEFTRFNLALARNCACKLDEQGGDAADNWRNGKPLRVCRSYKGKSEFAPEMGYRYDGIYKVVKYWKEKGHSGYFVYRYLLRRDDPTPAPWTKQGKQRIIDLGLDKVIMKELKLVENDSKEVDENEPVKRVKYTLDAKIAKLIESDTVNNQIWSECLKKCSLGHKAFVDSVEDAFTCIICCGLMVNPVTTSGCRHSFCQKCLARSLKVQGPSCPTCRALLSQDQLKQLNVNLNKALGSIFVGYNNA